MLIKISKGLDIPIAGEPEQRIHDAPTVQHVAVLGQDQRGAKRAPSVLVKEGDRVKLGQPLMRGKSYKEVTTTAPGAGVVEKVSYGKRRFANSISIRLEGDEQETFNHYREAELAGLNRDQVKENLVASGLWLALRTRPYTMVPHPEEELADLLVTAIDTNPLAPDPQVIIAENPAAFENGLRVLRKLTAGKLFVCKAPGAQVPVPEDSHATVVEFSGPHPAGLPGTHIHFLSPVNAHKTVGYVGYQDVISIGALFTSGRIHTDRVVSIAGPVVPRPRLLRTRLGASIPELVAGLRDEQSEPCDCRFISGSILSGHRAVGANAFLGRFHNQISVLKEGTERELLGWMAPGKDKFSASNVFLSSLFGRRKFAFTTSQNGSPRAMVPIGSYERVMPLDILPTQLLRALVVGDSDLAQALGCLELDEEDLALCSFVDTGKYDFGPILRETLELIRKEG
jgi:Na+-transporting NADH:ubiquinone oxidoreductase subunit A